MAVKYRESEWEQLMSCLYLPNGVPLPPALFVTGPPGSGKNLLVSTLLEWLYNEEAITTYAKVSCIPATIHVREVLDAILLDVRKHLNLDPDEGHVTNLADLVARLTNILSTPAPAAKKTNTKPVKSPRCIITLTNAEFLRHQDAILLPELLRLGELSNLDVCVIFVSRIHMSRWDFIPWMNLQPLTISLAPYDLKQLKELLGQKLIALPPPPKFEKEDCSEFLNSFVEYSVGAFQGVCKSLPQYWNILQQLLPLYWAPVLDGKCGIDNARAAIRAMGPQVKNCLADINLGESGPSFQAAKQPTASEQQPSNGSLRPSRLSIELPYYSKFLLIAAFLASYNPAKSDKKFFVVNSGRMRKKKNQLSVHSHKRSSQLLGPKPFPLDRMLAIFCVIVDNKVPPRSKLLNQVTTLVSLQLMSQVGSSDMDSIEIPKYKCNVGLDFIRLIAQNVKFEVHKYLYDISA